METRLLSHMDVPVRPHSKLLHCSIVAAVYVFSVLNNSILLALKILNICKLSCRPDENEFLVGFGLCALSLKPVS